MMRMWWSTTSQAAVLMALRSHELFVGHFSVDRCWKLPVRTDLVEVMRRIYEICYHGYLPARDKNMPSTVFRTKRTKFTTSYFTVDGNKLGFGTIAVFGPKTHWSCPIFSKLTGPARDLPYVWRLAERASVFQSWQTRQVLHQRLTATARIWHQPIAKSGISGTTTISSSRIYSIPQRP